MLNEIFNEYKGPTSSSSLITSNNASKTKTEDKNKDAFLNEEYVLSMKSKTDEVMQKYCTLYDKDSIKPLNINYLNKKHNREESKKTAGPQWFNFKPPEITPELKDDLKAMQLKQFIDPTNFHKKNDMKTIPKYFQIGTIQDNIVDGKKNRLRKDQVHGRIIEELIDMDKKNNYSTRKFEEYQDQRRKIGLKKTKLNKYKLQTKSKSKKVVFK